MQKFFVASLFIIILLTLMDALTTQLVVSSGIGYEVNPFVKSYLLGKYFIEFKVLIMSSAFLLAAFLLRKNERLLKACSVAVTMFYAIVVANNICVIFGLFDLNLTMPKLIMLAVVLFLISFKAIPSSQRLP